MTKRALPGNYAVMCRNRTSMARLLISSYINRYRTSYISLVTYATDAGLENILHNISWRHNHYVNTANETQNRCMEITSLIVLQSKALFTDSNWLKSSNGIRSLIVKYYTDVIMGATVSQITSLTIVYSTVYSNADQRKYQSSASLAFVRGIHRRPVNSPHKWPVTREMFPFDDVIMDLSTWS